MVSAGIAEPDLILRPGASPHDYALKPSEAGALDGADVVVWIGEGLEPWMAKAVTSLAADALVIELGRVEGTGHLAAREGGVWGDHEHGQAEEEGGDERHARGDPHLWLDPDNALVWLAHLAAALAEHDPAHADAYRRNAEAARLDIETAAADVETLLQPIREKPYVVFHDAYHYFEQRFGLRPLGAISLSDADRPGPARLRALRTAIAASDAVCVFAEPQFEPRLIETVIEGTDVKTGTLDPIGAGLQPGAGLYPALIRGLARSLVDCLG
jgi:zinc transport system substrate-binding protein